MTIKEIITHLEEWAPASYAEDFDNTGLLTGNAGGTLTGILIAHDTLEETVDEAIAKSCNLIVSFHPIIFSGLKRLTGSDYVQRAVIKALRHNIAIYALHTALDNRIDGVSGAMAEAWGLQDIRVMLPKEAILRKLRVFVPKEEAETLRKALFSAGAGNIGNYSHCSFNVEGTGTFLPGEKAHPVIGERGKIQYEPETSVTVYYEVPKERAILQAMREVHPYEEIAYEVISLQNSYAQTGLGVYGYLKEEMTGEDFLSAAKRIFKTPHIRHSALTGKPIRKVALLGGSGAFGIEAAKALKADAYITSDLKYHDFFKAEKKILLLDVGHYESERFTKKLIYSFLTKKMSNIATQKKEVKIIISQTETNPVNYY